MFAALLHTRQGKCYNNLIMVTTKLFSTDPRVIFSVESIFAWDIFEDAKENAVNVIILAHSHVTYLSNI